MRSGGNAPPKLFDPFRVWLAIVVAMLALQIGSSISMWQMSQAENQVLVEIQRQTLVRARLADLEVGDFRAVVEGLGAEFPQLFVEVETSKGVFRYGELSPTRKCSSGPVTLHSANAGSVMFTLCRPYAFPLVPFAGIISLFFVASAFCMLTIARTEGAAVATLTRFLASQGVDMPLGRGFAGVLSKMTEVIKRLDEAKRREIEIIKAETFIDVANQVAHDIVSPLATLDILVRPEAPFGEEHKPLLRSAVDRIHAIANDLVMRAGYNAPPSDGSEANATKDLLELEAKPLVQPALPIVDAMVSEKQIEFLKRSDLSLRSTYCSGAETLLVKIDGHALKRALSNVINNAVEALPVGGTVTVGISTEGRDIIVSVQDDGKGIPPEILSQLLKSLRLSHGKVGGKGLGLGQARSAVHAAGGKVEIRSEIGKGTKVELWLPKAKRPT